jgi:hypothetical protein
MATPDEIAALRGLVNESESCGEWDDETLAAIIDESTTMNGAASVVWTRKAAASSTLVDVSESGSSRKLSDIHKNALAMAKYFGGLDEEDGGSGGTADAPVIHRIRRTFA